MNRYAYCLNNPLKYVDPDGRNPILILLGLAVLADALMPESAGAPADSVAASQVPSAQHRGMRSVVLGGIAATEQRVIVGAAKVIGILSGGRDPSGPGINMDKQGKHIPGHPNYRTGRSILRADPLQLAKRAGSGEQVGNVPVGQAGSKERIDFEEVIGDYVDPEGNSIPTTRGIVHYSEEDIHIVPSRP